MRCDYDSFCTHVKNISNKLFIGQFFYYEIWCGLSSFGSFFFYGIQITGDNRLPGNRRGDCSYLLRGGAGSVASEKKHKAFITAAKTTSAAPHDGIC